MPKPLKKAKMAKSGKLPTPPKAKRPSDPNRAAHAMIAEHLSRVQGPASDQPIIDAETVIREHMRKLGAKGGKIGGKRRLVTMTAQERSQIALAAANKRWAQERKKRRKP